MLIRAIVLFLLICSGCNSGIIPCPEVKSLKLRKSQVNKRHRSIERSNPRDQAEPIVTVSSDAKTPQQNPRNSNRYKYVKYTIEHVDVEDLDCPKPGDKKMPKAVKENIRKNRKNVRYYFEETGADSLASAPARHPQR